MDNIEIIVQYPNSQNVEVVVDYSQPGADGQSAYQSAVDHGFIGTEQQWLDSLKGEAPDISGKVDKTTTVNGHALSGNVVVTKIDLGLGLVDNTSDINKPVSTDQRIAIDLVGNQLPAKASVTYVDGQDASVVTQLLGSAPTDANTLKKLNDKISALSVFLNGTDVNMDSILELANAVNDDQGLLDALSLNKLNKTDVYNALDSVLSGKALDSRQGKVLNDLIALNTAAILLKADTATVVSALALKADAATVTSTLALKADDAATTTALGLKAPVAAPVFSTSVALNYSTNGSAKITAVNTNSGTSADARMEVSNGTVALQTIIRGPNYTSNGNNAFFSLSGSGIIGWLLNGVERMRLLANGNLGIGTSSPSGAIHLARETVGVGTISTTATGTTVTGTNTDFVNRFKIGQTITANGETRTISAIASDTSMTTDAWTNTNTGISYTTTSLNVFVASRNGNVSFPQLTTNGGVLYINGTTGLVAQSVATVDKLNLLSTATGITGGATSSIVFSSNPALVRPRLTSFTVATLPAAPTGFELAIVTDALNPTYLGALTGGGSVTCPVFWNGTSWRAH